jgi:hypothetical protein
MLHFDSSSPDFAGTEGRHHFSHNRPESVADDQLYVFFAQLLNARPFEMLDATLAD